MRLFKKGKKILRKEEDEIKDIGKRIIKRDFSGNAGQAIKNSTFQFFTNITSKVGALIFTIILARLLMPELFGLYSLALGTIGIFAGFTDLGFGQAFVRFVSRELSKKKPNALGYYNYLLRIRILLAFITSLCLISLSYILANFYYHKPIFYALLAGGLYIFVGSFVSFFSLLYQASNNFKRIWIKEILFQILRLVIIPLSILYLLNFSNAVLIAGIVILLVICYTLVLVYLLFKKPLLEGNKLSAKQKKEVKRFTFPLTFTVLSGVFFGYIDMFMLGYFVKSEFIGYYSAAFALVNSVVALMAFSSALFPIFSRLKGKQLEKGFRKSLLFVLPISLVGVILTIVLSKFIVLVIYGPEYGQTSILLKAFSLLILSGPIAAIYTSYFVSRGRTMFVAKALISSTVINIALNYILISTLVRYSPFYATIGAVIATLVSRYFYLGVFVLGKKN